MLIMNNDNKVLNNKIIEVVHDYSETGCLKQTDFKNNLIVCLPLELNFGNLKLLDNYDRSSIKVLFSDFDYLPFETDFNFKNEINELKTLAKEVDKIRVWSSRISASDYLLFLYICYLFSDKNISVIFTDEYNEYAWGIGCMTCDEVNKLTSYEHALSQQEKDKYIDEWKKVVEENSNLRYIKDNKIISVDINYFDDIIISYLKEEKEMMIYSLVAKLMCNFVIDSNGDFLYLYLINRLIDNGRIKVIGKDDKNRKILRANC